MLFQLVRGRREFLQHGIFRLEQIEQILRVVSHDGVRPQHPFAGFKRQHARQHFQQRSLASAVRADQSHPVAAVNREV